MRASARGHEARVEIERLGIDVNEDRRRTHVARAVGARDEGERGGRAAIARTEPGDRSCGVEGGGPA